MLIPTPQNTRNITDFRKDPDSILEAVKENNPLYLFRGSTPKAVVLDLAEYISLQERLEDYYDSLLARELEKEPVDGISFDEFLKEHNIILPGRKKKREQTKK